VCPRVVHVGLAPIEEAHRVQPSLLAAVDVEPKLVRLALRPRPGGGDQPLLKARQVALVSVAEPGDPRRALAMLARRALGRDIGPELVRVGVELAPRRSGSDAPSQSSTSRASIACWRSACEGKL